MAMHSDLQKQIDLVNSQVVVSTDFVGSRHAGVVDAKATIANDNRVVLYVGTTTSSATAARSCA